MSEIDWSEAPEGATHFGVENEFYFSAWYKVEGEQILAYTEDGSMWREATDSCVFPKVSSLSARPEQWSGEGLPPVGTVCEFAGGTPCPDDPFDKDLREGMQVKIIAHFKSGDFTLAAFTFDPENPDRGMVQVEQGNFGCFRPIRTAEQIAADERLHEIRNALTAINSKVHFPNDLVRGNILTAAVEAMIDAGYRKQEAS